MASHTVYAVASGKGGVGKTATTVNLGASLAAAGYTVAIVDTDLGMANLGGFVGIDEEGATLHEVLAGEVPLEEAVYEAFNGLAVVPSGISLHGFANVETAAMSDAVGAMRDAFDYVLLDLGAGLSHDTVLPLALADAVVLVSTPQPLSIQDTAKTREVTQRLGGQVAGVVLTRAADPEDLDLAEIRETLELPVLAVIPEDEAVPASARAGESLLEYAPDSPAAEGYRGLASIVEAESLADAPVVPEVPDAEPSTGRAADAGQDTDPGPAPDARAGADAADAGPVRGGEPAGEAPPDAGTERSPAEQPTDAETPVADAGTADAGATPGASDTDGAVADAGGAAADESAGSEPADGGAADDGAETTAAEIAAAIEEAAAASDVGKADPDATDGTRQAEEAAAADEPDAPRPEPGEADASGAADSDASEAAEADASGAAGAGTGEAGEGGAAAGGEAAGGDDATADDEEAAAPFKVESVEEEPTEEEEAVDQLFSVEGASPEPDDDDDEEESKGLFGRFLG